MHVCVSVSMSDRRLWLFACRQVFAVAPGAEPAAESPSWRRQPVTLDTPVSLPPAIHCLPEKAEIFKFRPIHFKAH